MRFVIVFLLLVSANCFSDSQKYQFTRSALGPHIDFRVNSISDISIPLSILDGAKVAGIDGLVVILKNKSGFSVDTLTAKSIGYPDADMRLWPLYMLGQEPDSLLPVSYIDDVKKARAILRSNDPYKSGSFKTRNGRCFVLVGNNKSTIYITDDSNREFITTISATGMSEHDIQQYLLQGVF